jgi:prepilin-type N-terminal cleavage/methylation domain-containing protein
MEVKNFNKTKQRIKITGFTLIELLVVITIIGTLSGVVMVSLTGARASARDAIRQSDMRQLVSAQGIYYGFNDKYYGDVEQEGTPQLERYLSPLNDPFCPEGVCDGSTNYVWKDNRTTLDCDISRKNRDPRQWFCVYVTLEEKSSSANNKIYFRASHQGTKKLDLNAAPTVAAECTCFD